MSDDDTVEGVRIARVEVHRVGSVSLVLSPLDGAFAVFELVHLQQ